MALGSATVLKAQSDGPLRFDRLTFDGDDDYQAGGTTDFTAYVRDAVGLGDLEIVGILPQDCAGTTLTYLPGTDALKAWQSANGAADDEDTTNDQSGRSYSVIVVSK